MKLELRFCQILLPWVLSIVALLSAAASEPSENVDHSGIISGWDGNSLERGRKLFQIACAPCHGTNGVQTINPQSRPFAVDKFRNGNDPYRMFKTITEGYKNMPSQLWMTPSQRYEVIQFIRETFLKTLNPSQYFPITPDYLSTLPKYDAVLANASEKNRNQIRDYGPALESQLGTNFCDALTIKLPQDVTLSYDLHRMKLAGAWKGGFLDLSRTGHSQQRGEGQPLPKGQPLRGLGSWSWAMGGSFDSLPEDTPPRGPIPAKHMKYLGHYVYNREAVLSYEIEGRHVLELPGAELVDGKLVVSHTLEIAPGNRVMRLCVAQGEGTGRMTHGLVAIGKSVPVGIKAIAADHLAFSAATPADVKPGTSMNTIGEFVSAGVLGSTKGLTWEVDERERLVLGIPADSHTRVLRILCAAGAGIRELESFGRQIEKTETEPLTDPAALTSGGARLWPMELEVRGVLGNQTRAYALDTVPVPFENPYGSWPRTSALAFFPDGRAVVTTYGGDVWIVSGLDSSLQRVKWSRFAAGLYEPFGAAVIDGKIYLTCRNGIVRLHDLNGNGEADFYETFYADTDVSTFFHSFNFDLIQDERGHLFYLKPGEYTDYKVPGAILDILPDGSSAQVYCTGFRVPNGLGLMPDGRLTASDNQGNWMPASKINLVRRGGFYGYVQNLKVGGAYGDTWAPDGGQIEAGKVRPPATFDQPIIWMPQEFDNSSSGQLFVQDSRFGPLSGRLLHTSFGKGWMYYLMLQEVGQQAQAAIVALPFQFDAGLMRARVNPADGQVYATGLSGWQGPANGKDGCLQRLRYTGKPILMLDNLTVGHDDVHLRFNFVLDAKAAVSPESYHLEQWNYFWSADYGSDQYSAEHPGQKGHDLLEVKSLRLDADGRGTHLNIIGLRPVNQVELKISLKSEDGAPFSELVYVTINAVPER